MFLGPKQIAELTRATKWGPIVSLSVWVDGGAALILTSGSNEVKLVPLLDITYETASKLWQKLDVQLWTNRARSTTERHLTLMTSKQRESHDEAVREILGQLWARIVKPVLDALEILVC